MDPVTDDNHTLQRLCAKLEYLLQTDMKARTVRLTGARKDYWDMIYECISSVKGLRDGLKWVKSNSEIKTSLGKGRALIRFSLVHHRLADTLQHCVMCGQVISSWYEPQSLWLNFEQRSRVISALYDLNDITFDLSPDGHDLDNVWPSFAKGGMTQGAWRARSRTSSISSLLSIPTSVQDSLSITHLEASGMYGNVDERDGEATRGQTDKISIVESGDRREQSVEDHDAVLMTHSSWVDQAATCVRDRGDATNEDVGQSECLRNILESDYAALDKKYADLKLQYDEAMCDWREQQAEKDACLAALEREVGDARYAYAVLESDYEKLKSELSERDMENCGLSDEIAQLENDKCVLQREIAQLENDYRDTQGRYDAIVGDNELIRDRLRTVEADVIEERVENERVIVGLQAEVDVCKTRCLQREIEMEKLRCDLDALQQVFDVCFSELSAFESRLCLDNDDDCSIVQREVSLTSDAAILSQHSVDRSSGSCMSLESADHIVDCGHEPSRDGDLLSNHESSNVQQTVDTSDVFETPPNSPTEFSPEKPPIFPSHFRPVKDILVKIRNLTNRLNLFSKDQDDRYKDIKSRLFDAETKVERHEREVSDITKRYRDLEIINEQQAMEIFELKISLEDSTEMLHECQMKIQTYEREIGDLKSVIDENAIIVGENEAIFDIRIEERDERLRQLLGVNTRLQEKLDLVTGWIREIHEDLVILPKAKVIEMLERRIEEVDLDQLKDVVSGKDRVCYVESGPVTDGDNDAEGHLLPAIYEHLDYKVKVVENDIDNGMVEGLSDVSEEIGIVEGGGCDLIVVDDVDDEVGDREIDLGGNEEINRSASGESSLDDADDGQLIKLLSGADEDQVMTRADMDRAVEETRIMYENRIETLTSEVSSLRFELSSAQMQQEVTYNNFNTQHLDIVAMVKRLSDQQAFIDNLEMEMGDIKLTREREMSFQKNEISQLHAALKNTEDERVKALLQREEMSDTLELERSRAGDAEAEFAREKERYEALLSERASRVSELEGDMVQLKRKLVHLLKEKDALWHKTDSLVFEKKLQAADKWMSDTDVLHCMGCRAVFSFTVRRHHCRLCGKIYCYMCCNNWVMTTHSSKKSRVCNSCYVRHSDTDNSSVSLDDSGDEDGDKENPVEESSTADVGTSRTVSLAGADVDSNTSKAPINSSNGKVAMTSLSGHNDLGVKPVSVSGRTHHGWNETDDNKRTRLSTTGDPTGGNQSHPSSQNTFLQSLPALQRTTDDTIQSSLPIPGTHQPGASRYDEFDVISDEEIARSLTLSGSSFSGPESSAIISSELLSQGTITSSANIAPGHTFYLPIAVTMPGDVLCWQFTSNPKDVEFGVAYREEETTPPNKALVLVAPCRCRAHRQKVKGELITKKSGIYSLQFINTMSNALMKHFQTDDKTG